MREIEELNAATVKEADALLNATTERLVRNKLHLSSPDDWEMTTPKRLVGTVLPLVAIGRKILEEAGEKTKALREYAAYPTEENLRKVLIEFADGKQADLDALKFLGVSEQAVEEVRLEKQNRKGGFDEFILMDSKPKHPNVRSD